MDSLNDVLSWIKGGRRLQVYDRRPLLLEVIKYADQNDPAVPHRKSIDTDGLKKKQVDEVNKLREDLERCEAARTRAEAKMQRIRALLTMALNVLNNPDEDDEEDPADAAAEGLGQMGLGDA